MALCWQVCSLMFASVIGDAHPLMNGQKQWALVCIVSESGRLTELCSLLEKPGFCMRGSRCALQR